jgi:alpha-methylacyl-CoA racemase
MSEAVDHPHIKERGVFVEHDGLVQPAPAPRFSRTEATLALPPAPAPGAHTREALLAWGIDDVEDLIASGAAVQTT